MIGAAFGDTLARAQAGDETAFACIFRDMQPALLRYLRVIESERMLVAVTGPAEHGELAGETAALAAFARLASPAGVSPAAPRSTRRWLSGRPARAQGA